jgi:2-succinyl-6-hydroxy-2,4-cyclohexadiene-1-carboxylate synthase
MNIRVRGISYAFERHQEKPELPNLVLLHGFMGRGTALQPLIDRLTPFCNPITIDLLGHGDTEGAELHYRFSAKEQVADLVKLISEQLSLPLFLYGYSMGARLALQIAVHRKDLLQGLILESGTFGIESETERQARQALDASRADQITGNFEGFLKDWKSLPLFKSGKNGTDVIQLDQIQAHQNPTWMANSLLGFGSGTMPCLREHLPGLPMPVQLIVGEKDSKFIRINQTMNRDIKESQLNIIPDAGHRVHIDQPETEAEVIKDFITTNLLP